MNEEQIRCETEKLQLLDRVKYWKSRCEAFEQDKTFL
jgi:hypothetical protein